MNNITDIKAQISAELDQFNNIFDSAFDTNESVLKDLLEHVRLEKGKQLRPMLTIYFAKLCGQVNDKILLGASAIEMLHTASLIHDDVVDESMKRRNRPSVNAIFDNKKAVLIGDYLLTKAMDFMAQTKDFEMINSINHIAKNITRGEFLQLQLAYTIPSEEEYTEIIKNKTAILFSICATIAAISNEVSEEKRSAIEDFAANIGICFQIKDDILDYTKNAEIGKPIFNDIREGKITLPLLHALERMNSNDRNYIMRCISKNTFNSEVVSLIHKNIAEFQGIEYATKKMEEYKSKAIAKLDIYSDSIEKTMLINLAQFILDRKQ